MKAVLVEKLGSIDGISFKEHKLPKITDDQVKIKVAYAGVNFPDILITKGMYQFQPELPFSPGGEVSGEVIEVGKGITHLSVGDRVVSGSGWGGFAEEVISFGFNTHKLPRDISLKDGAATLMTYGTVIHALKDRGQLKNGEVLAILGASGGVGTAAIQVGKVMGAKVIACASNQEKLDYCQSVGADETVDYSKKDLKSELKKLSDGGVDVVFDPIGGKCSEEAFRSIARGGRHLVVGFASGQVPQIPWNLPLLKSASIVGVFWGGFFRNSTDANAENVKQLFEWMVAGKIKSTIQKIFPLSEAKAAMKMLERRAVKGKVLLSTN